MDRHQREMLDRHITGNYGEDFFDEPIRQKPKTYIKDRIKPAIEGSICSIIGCGKPAKVYVSTSSWGLNFCEDHHKSSK